MKKTTFILSAIAIFAFVACGGNNTPANEDSLTYDEVKAQLDSTNNISSIEQEQWVEDTNILQWDE